MVISSQVLMTAPNISPTGGTLPDSAFPGKLPGSPLPTNETSEDEWAARHDAEIWGAGDWLSDATGFYE
jgi:hypothetical protein